MRGARTSRPELAREENQRSSDQAGAAQQPEAIEEAKKGCLLLDDSRQLCLRAQGCVWSGETVRRKVSS